MKIDYKITTIVLAIVLVIWLLCSSFGYGMGSRNNMMDREDRMDKKDISRNNKTNGMHMMGNGQMMSNDGMMMGTSTDMESMMMDMTAGMKGKSGTDLEKVFLKEMVVHHQGAVDMAKLLLMDKTIKPDLRTFAEKIIAAQNPEIVQMTAWLKGY